LDAVQVEVDPSVTRMEDVMPDMCAAVRHQTNTITMDMSIQGTRLSRIENQLNRIETNLYRYNSSIGYAFSSIGTQLNQAGSQFEVELGPVDSVFESLYSPENREEIIAQTAPRKKFKMIRDEQMTVKELWEEWTIGYPLRIPPIPSIRSLETEGIYWISKVQNLVSLTGES
jgi:hypothetical protein